MKPRLMIEFCPSYPNLRNYNSTAILATNKGGFFKFPIDRHDVKNLKKIGQVGREVIESLTEQSGIEACFIEIHKLIVLKNSAFHWNEVEVGVINALRIAFGKDCEAETVKKPKKKLCLCHSEENPQRCLMQSEIHESMENIS